VRTAEKKQLSEKTWGWFNAPNAVSMARLALAPLVAWAILANRSGTALILFGIAALTDFLDGYLARNIQATTRVGQFLDPIADKILLCVVFVALGAAARVPVWFVAIIFGRDLALLVASAIAMKVSSYNNYRPTIWGKLSTFFQIIAAIAAMGMPGSDATRAAVFVSAAATLWSAVHYTYRGVSFFWGR
jgi:cardiolipin synthase (CMP-forming)